MNAQQPAGITGEYYLRGVMETASGIKLNEDSSFNFFFSYGALDRGGEGSWTLKGNKVILNSPKIKEQSFNLLTHKTVEGDQITIRIIEQNVFFLPHVYAIVKSGNKQLEAMCDKEGKISFPKQAVDSIVLLFEFCPEKMATFTFSGKENYFEFRFDPSIMNVFFDNLSLDVQGDELLGQHPLLKQGTYHFIKN